MSNTVYPTTAPTFKVTADKRVDGLSIELNYWQSEPDASKNVSILATKQVFNLLKEKVKREIPDLLTYANFLGEAEIYMVSKGIPFNKKIRQEYAIAIRQDFIDSLDQSIFFDDTEGVILMSPYIFSLEAGDFYRPSVQFVSKTILAWLDTLQVT